MHIDLRTVSIKPLRHTFDNVARRIGGDKPASRYQEGTLDMQQTANFHYRPTWDPAHEIYDASRTAIKMLTGTPSRTRGSSTTAPTRWRAPSSRTLPRPTSTSSRTAAWRRRCPMRCATPC